MSLSASLFAGVSGLRNHQIRMDVIGDNVANVNTIGFKSGRANFQEALVQTLKGPGRPSSLTGGTNPVQLGLGMQIATIDKLFQQGGLETTGQITDLAIQGNGFFVLSDNSGVFYSRAGAFGFDANSNLVEPSSGLYVQGRMADSLGDIPTTEQVGNITLPFGQQDPARSTTSIRMANNLDASATDSSATLVAAGPTNVSVVTGTALNGVGGTHTVTILRKNLLQPSLQPTNSSLTGANLPATDLTLSTRLSTDLGVTNFQPFSLTLDGGPGSNLVNGLSDTSTVGDLINAINQVQGVTASLVAVGAGHEIRIVRDYAGSGGTFNIQSSPAYTGDVLNRVFGVAGGVNPTSPGSTLLAANGLADNFSAVDTIVQVATPVTVNPTPQQLQPVYDPTTGMVIGISGLGGNGVKVEGAVPLAEGTVTIRTEPTRHATSITVFDSQGGLHAVTIEFTKQFAQNTWSWETKMNGNEVLLSGSSGEVRFNPDGSLQSISGGSPLLINPNNGAESIAINIDSGTVSDFNGLTGFASPHTAAIVQQDGYTVGILDKISIDKQGNINGIFTNGVTRRVAQVALADFNNQAGLIRSGRSMFQASANSGQAVIGVAGETISGAISSGALESSSVDIAAEFTNMIVTQRGFQANSRIITTSDSMLEELVNLRR